MTGTSLDGLDAALVRITGSGLDMSAEYLGHVSREIPAALRDTLFHLASGGAAEPLMYLRAARELGELHAVGVKQLLDETRGPKPEFVVAHGQTIWHAPRDDGGPKSWQLFDPWPVVKCIGVPVCYDLRQADLIAGGEGAPLTPLADWVMYRGKAAIVINLGGVGNATWLAHGYEGLNGCDWGGCNLILDGMCQRLFGESYDRDGLHASKGNKNPKLSGVIGRAINQASLGAIKEGKKSLGREDFTDQWFLPLLREAAQLGSPEDILHETVWHVSNKMCQPVDILDEGTWPEGQEHTIVLAGGGARNKVLVDEIRKRMTDDGDDYINYRYRFILSDDLGIPCEAREAMGFAVLGALSQDGVPVSLPQVTGAKDPGVAGVWAGVAPSGRV